jgi:hypothetical protein
MPAKMARSAPRPPFGPPELPVMRRHLASVLWQGRKTPILTSSGAIRGIPVHSHFCIGYLNALFAKSDSVAPYVKDEHFH